MRGCSTGFLIFHPHTEGQWKCPPTHSIKSASRKRCASCRTHDTLFDFPNSSWRGQWDM